MRAFDPVAGWLHIRNTPRLESRIVSAAKAGCDMLFVPAGHTTEAAKAVAPEEWEVVAVSNVAHLVDLLEQY